RLDSGSDQAELHRAQPLQSAEALDDLLEHLDPVPQPGRFLVTEVLGQMRKLCSQARQRPAPEEVAELLRGARAELPRREGSTVAARDRAELGRFLGDDNVFSPALQVEAVPLPAAADIGRRIVLADQPQLLE